MADFQVIYLGHLDSRGNSVLQSTMYIFKLVTKKWKGHELAIAKNSDMNCQELKDLKENDETDVSWKATHTKSYKVYHDSRTISSNICRPPQYATVRHRHSMKSVLHIIIIGI